VMKQIDRRERRHNADHGRESDQPQIMGIGDAIVDFQHMGIPSRGDTAMAGTSSGNSVRSSKANHHRAAGLTVTGGTLRLPKRE
jgi:hypothetical protein